MPPTAGATAGLRAAIASTSGVHMPSVIELMAKMSKLLVSSMASAR